MLIVDGGKKNHIDYDEEYLILKDSGLVDSKFYNSLYDDVKKRNVDPIRHYIRYGHQEGRLPNKYFDTEFYKSVYGLGKNDNPLLHYLCDNNRFNRTSEVFDGALYYHLYSDVKEANLNPLVHYIKWGLKEGRKIKNDTSNVIVNSENKICYSISDKKVTILVPVFNAIDEVVNCIDSVLNNTNLGDKVSLIVLNDCSTDERVTSILDEYSCINGVRIVHNSENLGYTRNINKGIDLAGGCDVILLNSDTIVSPNWLRNLIVSAYSNECIGTVTAVSNGAGAFSVPKSGWNDIPEHIDISSLSRVASTLVNKNNVEVPTGNGFCLYIKRELINEIGNFDYDKFSRGYGEENDFCMRAIDYGWTNVIDLKTYVYHKRSASFKEEKDVLIDLGVKQVCNDYPNYMGAIKSIASSKIFSEYRYVLGETLKDRAKVIQLSKPKLMFVISTRTGGTPQTNYDLIKGIEGVFDCYVLASNAKKIEILRAGSKGYEEIESFEIEQPVKFSTHRSSEYESLVKWILYKYNIELLHIRHMAWHSIKLPEIAKDLFIPVVNSFHDFYTICPSVNLVDSNGQYIEDGVPYGLNNPLWNDETVTPMTQRYLDYWKHRNENALKHCDHFITTCESAKNILKENMPALFNNKKDNFSVIPHGRDFSEFTAPRTSIPNEKIKVLVPGNITLTKGMNLIKEISSLDLSRNIEFHVLGTCDESLLEYVIYHGKYDRDTFQNKVKEINPDIGGIFSIWPETYCHTLTECWASGLPVLGLSYGAVENRINSHGGGWLVENNAKECVDILYGILRDKGGLIKARDEVLQWQNEYGNNNTVSCMSGKYISIYQSLLKGNNVQPRNKKLGMIMKGYYPDVPATAYVRIVDWVDYFEREKNTKCEFIHWSVVLTQSIKCFGEVVIQRDAIPSYAVDWCLNALKVNGINYIYEIDDNLLDVPSVIDTNKAYANYKEHFKKLLSNASSIHVTNHDLKLLCERYNKNVFIRENRICDKRWDMNFPKEDRVNLDLDENKFNILYFGSKTHQEDLVFILDVLLELYSEGHTVHLSVIGCGNIEEKYNQIATRIVPPSARYDLFVDWLKKVAHNFDLGVAPLVDLSFSKTKSPIKALEFIQLGLPVVCSDNQPYSSLKDNSRLSCSDVFYSKNDIESWKESILEIMKRKLK